MFVLFIILAILLTVGSVYAHKLEKENGNMQKIMEEMYLQHLARCEKYNRSIITIGIPYITSNDVPYESSKGDNKVVQIDQRR